MIKWYNFRNRFRKNTLEHRHENEVCQNCGTTFSGKFCPECGQSVRDYDKPFTFIFYNFLGDFFAFDTRFFRTFWALIIKPGFLTSEYFKGRRVKYAPPFRIFIFVSFVLFLLLQIYTNRGLTTVLDADLSNKNLMVLDSAAVQVADSVLTRVKSETDTISSGDLNFHLDLARLHNISDLRGGLNKFALSLEKKLETETNPEARKKLKEYIQVCRYPERAMVKILKYLSWAFFFLLPIFALVLKLAYIRRKQNYMRHLIFSIHIHSFIFIVLTIIVGLYLITGINIKIVTTILILCVPVYFILALKKFYGQSYGKVILKFFVVSFLYNIIFIFTVDFVFLKALSIF